MKKEDWQTIKRIFEDALAVPAADRSAYLDRQVGSEPEIRAEVESLLTAYESGFLEDSAVSIAAQALAESSIRTGQIIGRYEIAELIGTGGMGEVFRADDTELDRSVAFKVLHRDVAEDEERVRRFIQEARAASALNHPNILTIHEIGTFEGSRFIVSEYVEGETLREKMHDGLTTPESVDITCQIAAALQAAHSAGIVHRDIKPENVMIRKDGLVKVLDFGLAKLTEADDVPIDASTPPSRIHTSPGLVMGTVAYMSPEQAKGQPVDARTDLWSLGVVLHEMLTGSSPFEGESVTELTSLIIRKDTSPARLETLPSELRPICKKALAKDKDSRYRSAHDLLKDLEGEKKRMEYAIQPSPFITSSSTDDLKTQLIRPRPTLSAEYIVTSVTRHKYVTLFAVLMIALAGIGLSVYKFNAATPPTPTSDLSAINGSTTERDLKFSKLPISGETKEIVISPDGKYLAYSTAKSIRLMERSSSAETEIFSQGPIGGLNFSPDGQFVYYSFNPDAPKGSYGIMKLSIRGGTPVKVVDGPYDGLSFAQDGSTIAFTKEDKDGQLIMIADADGSNQRAIARSDWDHMIEGSPVFSPDGKILACNMRFDTQSGGYWQIVGYRVADGSQQVLSEKKWNDTRGTVWLPNGNLVVIAKEGVSDPAQLWTIQAGSEPRAITSGLASYQGLSATRSGDLLVTNQVTDSDNRDLWVLHGNDARTAKRVTTSGELRGRFAVTPDGMIVMTSTVGGNPDIWVMNASGGGRKQLTREMGINSQPAVSPDGKLIAFTSDRVNGVSHLFLMDRDGKNVKQLTKGDHEVLASFSQDGKWVFFIDGENGKNRGWRSIRKVSINGGDSILVATAPDDWTFQGIDINKADGRLVYGIGRYSNGFQYKLGILSSRGEAKLIDLSGHLVSVRPRWSPDNRSIVVISTVPDGPAPLDLWSIPVDGKGKPHQLTDFRTPGSADAKWTADGKQLFFTRGTSISNPVLIRDTEK